MVWRRQGGDSVEKAGGEGREVIVWIRQGGDSVEKAGS